MSDASECHCGKGGHALNSVNCPVHGYITVPKKEHTETLAVLNAIRVMIKNRDQRPEEMKLLDAVKFVIAREEGRLTQ